MSVFKNLFIILAGTVIGAFTMGVLAYMSALVMPDLMITFSQELTNNKELTDGAKGQQFMMAISLMVGTIGGFTVTALPLLANGMKNLFQKNEN